MKLKKSPATNAGKKEIKQGGRKRLGRIKEDYPTIFSDAPIGVFQSTLEGRIIEANNALAKMFGYVSPTEMIRGVVDVKKQLYVNGKSRDEIISAVSGHRKISKYETRFRKRDESVFVANLYIKSVLGAKGKIDHLEGFIEDLTDRKKAEDALNVSEMLYRRLFEAAQDGILILNGETGEIFDVNPFLLNLLGYSKAELVGRELWEIGSFGGIKASKKAFLELKENGYIRYDDLPLETKKGKQVNVEFVSNVYLVNNKKVIQCNIRDIKDRKTTEDALKESEEKFKKAFHSSPVIMGISSMEDGRYVDVNKVFEETIGWSRKEAIGCTSNELKVWITPKDRESMLEELNAKGSLDKIELGMRTKSGKIICLLWSAEKINLQGKEYLLASAVDITDRKEFENALKESEKRYRDIFENAIEGIYQSTPGGRYITVNPSFARMLGYESSGEVISGITNIGEQVYANPVDRENLKKQLSEKGYVRNFEAEIRRRDKAKVWISINAHVVKDDEGKILYYEGTNEDITERKKAQEMLMEYSARLEATVSERTKELIAEKNHVLELLSARTQMINQLSHDLRTPLTPITALIPLIEPGISDEKDKERFRILKNNVEYMRRLLVDTLNLARMDSKSFVLRKNSLNVRDLVNDLISGYEVIFCSEQIKAENKIPWGFTVKADDLRLREVFDNLVSNSVKYSPRGGIITFNAESNGAFLLFSISDEGVGVDVNNIGKLFMEFYKGDESRHNLESTGLGLTICRRIIEAHGGKIWAESAGIGKGLTVKFTLPAEKR